MKDPKKLYIKVYDQSGYEDCLAIESYAFEGQIEHRTFPPIQNPSEGKVKILTCPECGHRDFNSFGRFMHEYACNGCDHYVILYFGR